MLEAWGKPFQHGTCIAIAHGSEQAHHTPTNDCMVHKWPLHDWDWKNYGSQKVENGAQRFQGVGTPVLSDAWRLRSGPKQIDRRHEKLLR
jgi:hypothetical protein